MKRQSKKARQSNLYIYRPKYPNAAGKAYYQQKALDAVTAAVSVLGFVSAMVFLATMS